jgi:inosine/guanosine/xanthosine phosphorylase family protein
MEIAGMREIIKNCAAAVRSAHGGAIPRVAIQLGSGLNAVADEMSDATVLSYADIPGFPQPSVAGHAGRLLIGDFRGQPVLCLQGRVHYYEGQGFEPAVIMVRVLQALGVEILTLTNAAGSLLEDMGPGSLMVISDHINFSGDNPLIGLNDDAVGLRFPDMTNAYDPALRSLLHEAAGEIGVKLHEGVYLMASGPSFETPAEIRAFRTLGADAVGMSTVPECIAATHCGLRVAGVSTITNLAAGMSDVPLTHEETMREGAMATERLIEILAGFLKRANAL